MFLAPLRILQTRHSGSRRVAPPAPFRGRDEEMGSNLNFSTMSRSKVSANLSLDCHPEFPASLDTLEVTQSLGASRRKAGALPALDPDIIATELKLARYPRSLTATLAAFHVAASQLAPFSLINFSPKCVAPRERMKVRAGLAFAGSERVSNRRRPPSRAKITLPSTSKNRWRNLTSSLPKNPGMQVGRLRPAGKARV